MAPRLRYVDPTRPRGRFSRAIAALSATRPGRFLSVRVAWKVDPYLLRATRGRVGTGLVLPTALLETRGAKSGAVRRNAVIFFHDADRVTIIASKAGAERHPAWFHNLLAHPDVVFGGVPMRATVISDEAERRRLWALADRVFAPFAAYRREAAKANLKIPIVQLTAREAEPGPGRTGGCPAPHDTTNAGGLRCVAERVRRAEVSRALRGLSLSAEEERAIERMSRALVDGLMNGPISEILTRVGPQSGYSTSNPEGDQREQPGISRAGTTVPTVHSQNVGATNTYIFEEEA